MWLRERVVMNWCARPSVVHLEECSSKFLFYHFFNPLKSGLILLFSVFFWGRHFDPRLFLYSLSSLYLVSLWKSSIFLLSSGDVIWLTEPLFRSWKKGSQTWINRQYRIPSCTNLKVVFLPLPSTTGRFESNLRISIQPTTLSKQLL